MVETYIDGNLGIVGAATSRQFRFLVIEDAQHIGLPQSDIDALGLKPSLFAALRQNDGRKTAYEAGAHFESCYVELDVHPEAAPTVGVWTLRELGFQVNLEQGRVSKPAQPSKIFRGLMPTMLDTSDLDKQCEDEKIGS